MKYRREIDGLRAIAVIPVIFLHAGFEFFSGGYVGVDIFFVISGYLITCILIDEIDHGNFSIVRFYERRARRILPALFFVLLACLPFAFLWMSPSQLKDFSQSLAAVVFFASNVLFSREEGYFSAASELKPLLHTWSLAVEEQYYLLFPVFLLLLWRFGRQRVFWSVIAVAVMSLLLAEWGWRNEPSAAFYLAPTRAWELLAGSMCAFLTVGKAQRSSNVLSAIGLTMIVFSVFAYDASTPFPSLFTLVPVVGTTLIILFAASGTWVSQLLSLRTFVGIGLISYSAYLWHQPLFAFARLRTLTEPSHSFMAVLVAASLLLAWATWCWVEQPFRKRANPVLVTQRNVFFFSGIVGAMFVTIGFAGHVGNGFDWRFTKEVLRYADAESDRAAENDGCFFIASRPPPHPIINCVFPNADGEIDAILLGDSHALAISEMLGNAMLSRNIGYYDVSYSGCLPFPNLDRYGTFANSSNRFCSEFNESIYKYASSVGISTIVLTARYPLYLLGNRYENGEGGVENGEAAWVDLTSITNSVWNDDTRHKRVLGAFEQSIRDLSREFNVVLVYPIPEAGWNVPSYGFKNAILNGAEDLITTSYASYIERTKEVNSLFDRLVKELPSVHGARVQEILCGEVAGRCVNADANGVYYYDDDHLSNAGARLVAPTIVDAIEAAERADRAEETVK